MSKSRIYPVTKIDAAVDQLDWSIRLFLDEQAYVPAITLAGAAEEILGRLTNDLAMVKRLSTSLSQKHALPEKLLRDEHLNGLRNWLKHWNNLKDQDRVEVELETEAICMIVRGIGNLRAYDASETSESPRFLEWLKINRPDLY